MPSTKREGRNYRIETLFNRMKWRPRGVSNSELQYTVYDVTALCPQIMSGATSRRKIPQSE